MEQNNSIGIIELASISKGFEVQDAILKAADVEKLIAKTICSGKYLLIVRGHISAVEAGLHVAQEKGGYAIISATIIPRLDERIFSAIAGSTTLDSQVPVDGLLVIETFCVASAIKAADFALKEADIDILRIHVAMAIGGKGLIVIIGDMEALKSAIKPAIEYIKEEGMLAGYSLISNPHPDVLRELL